MAEGERPVNTASAARGKWKGILQALGVEGRYLTGKHCPCPMCGGKDRFRFDNQGGNGGFICGQCGAGNGFDMLKRLHGWDFAKAAREIDRICGNLPREARTAHIEAADRVGMLNRLWLSAERIDGQNMGYRYLAGRCELPRSMPKCLRFAPRCPAPDRIVRPALLALVTDRAGKAVNIHRTFLAGDCKAAIETPRAMMPGEVPAGSAVRLFPVHGERLGVAEGIETAFAAAARFGVSVWAALNAGLLSKWEPPESVREVFVFGDCDANFTGQAAAYRLAHRLTAQRGLAVQVHIPEATGTDWADVGQSAG